MPQSATDCTRVPRIADGRLVCVSGLAARPELNGTFGTTARYDAARGRHAVKLQATGKSAMLRSECLAEVLLPGAICNAAFAGDEAAVVAWLDDGGHVDARHPVTQDTVLMGACGFGLAPWAFGRWVPYPLVAFGNKVRSRSLHRGTWSC